MSQTVQLQQVTGAIPGEVTVNLDMLGFTDVAAVTLDIGYDQNLLTYTGSGTIPYSGGGDIVFSTNTPSVLKVAWAKMIGVPMNGLFVKLKFNYNGGFATDLTFQGTLEIANSQGTIITANYTNGSITPNLSSTDGSALIGTVNGTAGSNVAVPLTLIDHGGLSGVAASVNLRVAFDQSKLSYLGVSEDAMGFTSNYANGVITLVRSSLTPITSFPDPAINLNFHYIGGGEAAVTFLPGSVVTDGEANVLVMDFYNGAVNDAAPIGSPTLTIAKVSSVEGEIVTLPPPGGTVVVPVEVVVPVYSAGFSTVAKGVGSVSLVIAYDDAKLDYKGIINGPLGSGWTVTQDPGLLTISRAAAAGLAMPEGLLLSLKFDYYNGLADIIFEAGTIVNDTEGVAVQVSTVDGYITPSLLLSSKVILQGAWNGTNMNTLLRALPTFPKNQPYNVAPWNYTGSDTVTTVPADVVDWILVELRTGTASATTVARRAAFVLADGSITDLDGFSPLAFDNVQPDDYYIVIKHRNHLAIMSATAQTFSGASLVYDFTSSQSQSYFDPNIGLPQVKNLGGGFWGMIGGDGDADGKILVSDYFGVWFPFANQLGVYKAGDYNLNSNLLIADIFGIWAPNANLFTHVPN